MRLNKKSERTRKIFSFHVILFQNEHILLLLEADISVVVTEKIRASLPGCIGVREIMKIEPFFGKQDTVDRSFTGRIECRKYTAVLPENIVDAAHVIGRVFVQAIIIRVAAIIGTEFLVLSSRERLLAFAALADGHRV